MFGKDVVVALATLGKSPSIAAISRSIYLDTNMILYLLHEPLKDSRPYHLISPP